MGGMLGGFATIASFLVIAREFFTILIPIAGHICVRKLIAFGVLSRIFVPWKHHVARMHLVDSFG